MFFWAKNRKLEIQISCFSFRCRYAVNRSRGEVSLWLLRDPTVTQSLNKLRPHRKLSSSCFQQPTDRRTERQTDGRIDHTTPTPSPPRVHIVNFRDFLRENLSYISLRGLSWCCRSSPETRRVEERADLCPCCTYLSEEVSHSNGII